MTYNILDGGENRETPILDVIRTARPDVVVLQEVYTREFLQFLAQSLGMEYFLGSGNKKRKVALLSRLPVLSFESFQPLPIWRNFIDAKLEYEPTKTVRIIGVHLLPNLGIPFEIWRFWEAKYIANHMSSFQNESCLIAGDFNAIAPGEKVKTEKMPHWLKWTIYLQGNRVYHFSISVFLSAGYTDCFRYLNSGEGFTLPAPDPNCRLDYIFANANTKPYLKKCCIVREPDSVNRASDHYPVMAEFSFDH